MSISAGFEPAIFWSVVRRVIRCATSPMVSGEDTFCSMDQELDPCIWLCWGFHHNKSFLSVVVITCPSHGQGRRFDPGREQGVDLFSPTKVRFPCVHEQSGWDNLWGTTSWLVGLGVWFSLRVREVPGSNPGRAQSFCNLYTSACCISIKFRLASLPLHTSRFHGVMVSTLDSESSDPSSNLGGTSSFSWP